MEQDLSVFVYGSLQPGGRNWDRFCEGRVAAQQPARVRAKLFRLRDPYPAVVLDAKNWTLGWRLVLRNDDTLHGFDLLENFDRKRPPAENEYQRVRTLCFATTAGESKELGEAWIYVMTPERIAAEGGVEIPDGIWPEP